MKLDVSRTVRKGGAILSFVPLLLLVLFVIPAFAETTVRVLLLENSSKRLPQKNEKMERMGHTRGDVLLSGLQYSGKIEVWKGEKGLYLINIVPLEEYVKGVVSAEVGKGWDAEALKAQAVVARTYALYQMANNQAPQGLYNLTSSVLHQVYKSSGIPESVSRAVEQTRGEILTFYGRPILAYYHSTSGGMTEDPAEVFGKAHAYLRPVETNCELSPYYMWEKRIPVIEIEKALGLRDIIEIYIGPRTVSNRVRDLRIETKSGSVTMAAKDVRRKIGWDRLPSTMITTLVRDGDAFVFEGKGYGHGVGMCQWSALEMAKGGSTYRDILAKFYPGALIELHEDR